MFTTHATPPQAGQSWGQFKTQLAAQFRLRAGLTWFLGLGSIAFGAVIFATAHTVVIRSMHGRVSSYEIIHLHDGDSIRLAVTGDNGTKFEDQIPERYLSPPPPFLADGEAVTVYFDAATQPLEKSIYTTSSLVALSANGVTFATTDYRDPGGHATRDRLGGLLFITLGGVCVFVNVRVHAWPLTPRTANAPSGNQIEPQTLTGVVERKGGGWAVTWVSDGRAPASLRASSLTQLIAEGDAQADAIIRGHSVGPPAEVQYAIYPWQPSAVKMILDVTSAGEALEAREAGESLPVATGSDIDALVRNMEVQLPHAQQAMLRWIKTIR